uniref:SJCHGC05047 protein n=1 Tax=Schistosoma japonicum TaxID=6182 RepID=Q5DI51_SCHJA|nr:SJCHGC05047 protein [Schistosoma japonicum]
MQNANLNKMTENLHKAAYHLNLVVEPIQTNLAIAWVYIEEMDATVQQLQIEMQTSKKTMDTMPKTLGDLYNDIDKMESKPLMAIYDLNAANIRLNAAMEYGKMIDSLLSNFNNTFQNLQNAMVQPIWTNFIVL